MSVPLIIESIQLLAWSYIRYWCRQYCIYDRGKCI